MTYKRRFATRPGLLLIPAVLLPLLLLSLGRVRAQEAQVGQFEPVECWFEPPLPILPGPEFECGYVTVPERHEVPDGPVIRIPVAVARATGSNPEPDPLFLAQGGPGGDAFEIFPVLLGASSIPVARDIVVFNQRGTRYAQPDLSCTELFDAAGEMVSMPLEEADAESYRLLEACYGRLQAGGVDLSAYNSVQNAADVDVIRQALGYDTFNFYGVSYGTLLGLHLLRDHGEHVRSAILDGVVPTDLNFIPRVTENTDRVFTAVIEACQTDPACAADFPDLEERFFGLVEELNENPVELRLKDPETGQFYPAVLDGDGLVDVLFQSFYLPDNYAFFPKLVANLEKGDYTFIEGIWPLFAFDRTMSLGMYFSVICAEDADIDPAEANLEGVRPYFADSLEDDLGYYADSCAIWQVEPLPETVDDPVTSDTPVLLLSGTYDPITPPAFAEVAANGLTNDTSVVQPTGSHGVAFGDPCMDEILTQFLAEPGSELDTACLAGIERQGFAPMDAISLPIVGAINQLDGDVTWQLGLASVFLLIVLSAFLVLPLSWLVRVLSKESKPSHMDGPGARRMRWLAGALALLFGFLAVVFVTGLSYFVFDSLFSGLASIFAVSGQALPFLAIPPVLVLLAVLLVVIMIFAWDRHYWTNWVRIYFSAVAASAVAYVLVLGQGGLLTAWL